MKNVQNIIYFLVFVLSLHLFAQPYELVSMNGPNGGIIGDIAINSKGDIYAGVYGYWYTYYGLYKSTDNGNSWKQVEMPDDKIEIYSIYINKNDDIFVGTNFGGRIWRSTDNGETWENIREGYDTGECWAFGESLDGVIFAGDAQYHRTYRSVDYGNNWEYVNDLAPTVFATDTNNNIYAGSLYWGLFGSQDLGLTWYQNNFLKNIPVTTMLIDNLNHFYCGTGYYDNGNGVYYSEDEGATWQHLGLDSIVVLSLAFDSEHNLYAGTLKDGLFKTTDNGVTWTNHTNGLFEKQIFRMKINSNNDIFLGSEDEGIFRSTDGGESFEQIGLPISGMRNFMIAPNGNYYVATQSGVQEYNPQTKKWKNCGLHGVQAIDINNSTGELYAATLGQGLQRSIDYGNTWLSTSTDSNSPQTIYNVKVLADGSILIATSLNLRYSNNNGSTWKTYNNIMTGFFSHAIEIGKNGEIIVSGFNGNTDALFKSVDNGVTFTELLTFSPEMNYFNLNMIKMNSKGDIFICSYSNNNPVYIVKNGSNQLEVILNETANALFVDKNDWIYAGTFEKVFLSKDYGTTWNIIINEGLKYDVPFFITEDSNGFLFIGTSLRGLLKTTLPVTVEIKHENDAISEYSLEPNYPNPFNPSTTISYSIPNRDFVTLKVFDSLGKEIAVLENEVKNSGNYSVNFDASNLASGVYFYRLTTSQFSETKKMLLLQ